MSLSTFLCERTMVENVESLNIPQTPKLIDYIKNEVSSIIMLCKNIKIWFNGRSSCEAQSYVYTRYTICIPCLVFLFSAVILVLFGEANQTSAAHSTCVSLKMVSHIKD